MPQDHTLFEILRETSIRRWVQKSNWVAHNHGLVNVLVHPDYLLSDRRLDLYEQLLIHLSELSGAGTHCPVRLPAGGAYAPAWGARRRPPSPPRRWPV